MITNQPLGRSVLGVVGAHAGRVYSVSRNLAFHCDARWRDDAAERGRVVPVQSREG
ncbi:hypothetical protein [Haladaptatus sp. W1]|uniref:hypothetical protein n=1 Tax=Haladaptatus sp. W1 TaxID=1897478 RepID=UPI001585FEF8|nr:hypothetical protein [Haladaptatus sp. W1]